MLWEGQGKKKTPEDNDRHMTFPCHHKTKCSGKGETDNIDENCTYCSWGGKPQQINDITKVTY